MPDTAVFVCVRLCTCYMQLFIRFGPNETSHVVIKFISSRLFTMFPPHDSKLTFRPPALHRSHHPTVVSAAFGFPEEEEKVLKFWREIDAFQTSLKLSEGRPVYSFYDGPPFATGLPHYGHLLAGTIKVIDFLKFTCHLLIANSRSNGRISSHATPTSRASMYHAVSVGTPTASP